MDQEYEEAMVELHGEACVPIPRATPLDKQLSIVLPRVDAAFQTLAGWLLAGVITQHIKDMIEPGVRDGWHKYNDASFRRSRSELTIEAMEEIRDAIIYIAIMLEKEERGVDS